MIETTYGGQANLDTNIFKTIDEALDTLHSLSEINPRFEALRKYIIELRKKDRD